VKETKTVYNIIFQIIYITLGSLVRLLYPLRVIGKKNLKLAGKAYVLAPNHVRAIDPLYVLLARGVSKKGLIMGKEELFGKSKFLDFFWKVVGAFAIDRGAGNKDTLDNAVNEIQKGRNLLLFPEGTRSKDGNLAKLKSGSFVIAWQAGCDIVPCHIYYSKGKPKIFKRITIVFGKPVSMQELGLCGEYSVKKIREAKKIFTQKLIELREDNIDRL
jgi:1-acyl-sn-glycerol-3-phosphate acyltransferase